MAWPRSPAFAERSSFVIPAAYLPAAAEGAIGRIARPFVAVPWLLPTAVLLAASGLLAFARRRQGGFARLIFFSLGLFVLLLGVVLFPINFFAAGRMGDLRIGPFPKGTPINLVASMNPEAPPLEMLSAFWKMHQACRRIERENMSDEEATRVFEAEAGPALLKISKSPDWVEDRGHYFAAPLSDSDKLALKEFLKTF